MLGILGWRDFGGTSFGSSCFEVVFFPVSAETLLPLVGFGVVCPDDFSAGDALDLL